LEFHCKILNSYAIYRCKKMVKILNCYFHAKKSYGTLSKGAIFFGQPCIYQHIKLVLVPSTLIKINQTTDQRRPYDFEHLVLPRSYRAQTRFLIT